MTNVVFQGRSGVELEIQEGNFIYYQDSQHAVYVAWEDLDNTLQRSLMHFAEEITRRGNHLADRSKVEALRGGADPEVTETVFRQVKRNALDSAVGFFSRGTGVSLRAGGFATPGPYTVDGR